MAHGDFTAGEILTAANLNTHFDEKLDLAGGTMTGSVTGMTGLTMAGDVDMANNSIDSVGNLEFEPVTLADDEAAFVSFTADARGIVLISSNTSSAGTFIGNFRVNNGAFVQELASAGPVTVVAAGAGLGGMTGADGDFSIRAHDALNRLYIENRTGGQRTYRFTFVGMDGNASGGPTIV